MRGLTTDMSRPEQIVASELPRLERRIGKHYKFWRFLIDGWRDDGYVPALVGK